MKMSVAKSYVKAVQDATATIIIQAKEDRAAEEVERQ